MTISKFFQYNIDFLETLISLENVKKVEYRNMVNNVGSQKSIQIYYFDNIKPLTLEGDNIEVLYNKIKEILL